MAQIVMTLIVAALIMNYVTVFGFTLLEIVWFCFKWAMILYLVAGVATVLQKIFQ